MQSATKLRLTEISNYIVVTAVAIALIVCGRAAVKPISPKMKNEMNQFAQMVTEHLLDTNYGSYEQSTKALMSSSAGELSVPVVKQLQKQNLLPSNSNELAATAKIYEEQKRSSIVHIDQVNQQDLNAHGLVPIEVSGVVSVDSKQQPEKSPIPFRFRYLLGLRVNTQAPIVAKFQDLSPPAR